MVKNHAYLAPRINLFSNVTCQNVALSCRRSFLGVGKQTEPLWRNAYGTCDLPKTADVADAAAARQDLGDVRTVDPQPVRKLRLGQALLLHERRQDSANARTAQRQRLFWCRAAMTSPALARERRPHKPPPQPVWPPGYKPRAIRLFLANAHGATGPPPTSRQSSDATPGTARWPRPRLRRRFPSVLTPTMQRSWHGHTRSEPGCDLTAGGYHGRSLQRELASKPSHAMPSGFSSPPRKPRPKRGWRTAANRSFPGQGRICRT